MHLCYVHAYKICIFGENMKPYCDSFTSFLKDLVISIQLHLISSISSPVFRYDALIACVIFVVWLQPCFDKKSLSKCCPKCNAFFEV